MKRIVSWPIAFFVGSFIFMVSCHKKDLPAEVLNSPEFFVTCKVDQTNLMFQAGNDNYYMYASHFVDTNGVLVFRGDLKPEKCNSNCGYALSILINDVRVYNAMLGVSIDQALHTGEYAYNGASLPAMYYRAEFTPLKPFSNIETHIWKLKPNADPEMSVGSYSTTQVFEAGKMVTVSMHFDDGVGCNATHTNTFRIGNPAQAFIKAERDTPLTKLVYKFGPADAPTESCTYLWDFGDGSATSTESNPVHQYTPQGGGYYIAKLRVVNAHQDTCFTQYQVNASIDPSCSANFRVNYFPLPNTKAFSAITVLLTTPDGSVYSSRQVVQPKSSSFNVVSVNDFANNEHGEATKKVVFDFNCLLSNGNKQIVLQNGAAAMAVSYKK
jgi:hypothetical protein